ncbi:hypothetical protein Ddc_02015 [Ditylenchus destructor]|nr:hypothetical protein Ddc_02015 [Ditylenchus destructor]
MSDPALRPANSISLSSGTVLSSRPHVKTDYMAMLSFLENKGTRRNGDRNKDDECGTQASLTSSIVDEMHDTVQSVDHPKSKKKPPLSKCSPLRVPNYVPAPLPSPLYIDDIPLTQNTTLTHMPYAQEITDYDFGEGVLDFNTPTFDPQKPTTNEVQELREFINHHRWAGESLQEGLERFFEAMRRGWNELTADKEEFERKKAEENAKIASIRNSLTEEKKQRKSSLKSDEETIKSLETDVKKLKEGEAKQSRLISELRAKINHLEGEKKANDENNRMQLKKLKDQQETLTKTQVEIDRMAKGLHDLRTSQMQSSYQANPMDQYHSATYGSQLNAQSMFSMPNQAAPSGHTAIIHHRTGMAASGIPHSQHLYPHSNSANMIPAGHQPRFVHPPPGFGQTQSNMTGQPAHQQLQFYTSNVHPLIGSRPRVGQYPTAVTSGAAGSMIGQQPSQMPMSHPYYGSQTDGLSAPIGNRSHLNYQQQPQLKPMTDKTQQPEGNWSWGF